MAPRPLVAGNWKMNGSRAALKELAAMAEGYDAALRAKVDLMICPPAPLVFLASAAALGSRIAIGGQTCHPESSGAFTGEVSAAMLADAGASAVIVGHSERRQYNRETDADVAARAKAAIAEGLTAIVCVGETQAEREAGKALAVVARQLGRSVPEGATPQTVIVAYEPVWAIGTGLTPTTDDVAEVHALIRKRLVSRHGRQAAGIRLLYGGSVKPANAKDLMGVADVDGALVGGASLKAADFLAIAAAFR
ncbi:triose-phosphate isomerase [Phreatobacter sp.]|uniref:triose-phosphate isomerase n=1 Tax=Phreatobacter sp. TaxID=1966341 RepID=UPI003F70F0FA